MTREEVEEAKRTLFDMLGNKIIIEPTKQNKAILVALKALQQEPCEDCVKIPKGATFGDMIKTMFNIADEDIDEGASTIYALARTRIVRRVIRDSSQEFDVIMFDKEKWDSPYRKEQ